MIKVLGLADLMAGLVFLGNGFGFQIPVTMEIFFGLYLIGKGITFVINSLDWGSSADVGAGMAMIAAIFFPLPQLIFIVFSLF
mgnify:CR=1 FL=1